jgi:drug/metabolite transporter (DMT)-like permease
VTLPPELLAVAAPFCIAMGGMFSAELRGRLSVKTITAWRTLTPIPLLVLLAVLTGGWATIRPEHLPYLVISGVIGMVVADMTFSASIFAIGARLATLVFSLNAPVAAILALVTLGEPVSGGKALGIATVLVGVALAVLFRPADANKGCEPALSRSQLVRGVLLGATSAAAQATSVLLARPVMAEGLNGAAAMSIRLLAAGAVLLVLLPLLPKRCLLPPLTPRVAAYSVLGALIGVGAGVTMVFTSLQHGDVATVVTLASLTPVAVLPLVWIRSRKAPVWQAWAGAIVAFAGAALIANS